MVQQEIKSLLRCELNALTDNGNSFVASFPEIIDLDRWTPSLNGKCIRRPNVANATSRDRSLTTEPSVRAISDFVAESFAEKLRVSCGTFPHREVKL